MKKSDIAMIILIATVSVMTAYAIGNNIPSLKPPEGEKVKVAERIESDVATPDEDLFNSEAINPTVQTIIGTGTQ